MRAETNDPNLKSFWHVEALEEAVKIQEDAASLNGHVFFDVINMSFAWDNNTLRMANAIENLHNQGSKLVAAAGNKAGRYFYPAAYLEVTAVGCMYWKTGEIYKGNGLGWDIMAPGTGVETRVGTLSYTSMAAPIVSAMFVLGMSEYEINLWLSKCKPLGKKNG
jgi:subtilisin family serine protease